MLATIFSYAFYGLAGLMFLFVLIGFWRGLSLPTHRDGHRARQSIHWWYGPRD